MTTDVHSSKASEPLLKFAGEYMAADFVVIAQEVPVVARDVERTHPGGAAQADERAAEVAMLPSDLVFDDFDERLKGRRLRGHAAKRQLREFAGNANRVGRIAAWQFAVELLVEIVERGGGEVFDAAVLVEESYGGEWRCAVEVGHADGAIGECLVDLAVEHDHFAVKAVEGADAEVAAGEYVAKRCAAHVIVGRESGKQGELH